MVFVQSQGLKHKPISALERASNGRFRTLVSPPDRPAYLASLLLVLAYLAGLATGGPGRWGLSGQALAEGRLETLVTHMVSHAGWLHLLLNTTAMAAFSSPLIRRVGWRASGMRRLAILFLLSGLAGAALFLAVRPTGAIPMVGANGGGLAWETHLGGLLVGLLATPIFLGRQSIPLSKAPPG